jgi:NADH-quinone oxidoreductase subunit L
MIHAAAMVSAGVFAMIRLFPLMEAGSEGGFTQPMMFMAVIGSFTALFAATIAVAQNDIKRVLAFSTISQLGYMIAALGIGGYVAATFHLVTHAFFKALLFLGSGSVIHGMEHGALHTGDHHTDPQDMFNMGGLRKKMPITFWTFLIGGFALAGFPLITAGFWSKDEILTDAWKHAPIVFVVLALAALLTAFYTMRQITLTFLGEPRSELAKHAHETPWTMTLPLVILAFFSITFGWVGIPEYFPVLGGVPKALGFTPNWFHEFVGSSLPGEHGGEGEGSLAPARLASPVAAPLAAEEAAKFNPIPLVTSLVVSLGGLGLGYWVYARVKTPQEDRFQISLLKNKYYLDEFYSATFIRASNWVAEVFTPFVDQKIIDGILHGVSAVVPVVGAFLRRWIDNQVVNWFGDFLGSGTNRVGQDMKYIQTGKVQQYMLVALIFAALMMAYVFIIR